LEHDFAKLDFAKHGSEIWTQIYPFQATLGRHTGLPASHAGVADVSSTLGQLSAMVWIEVIIESIVGPRQTDERDAGSMKS
jgi:hypothetical protein